jgi:hypothetical protein
MASRTLVKLDNYLIEVKEGKDGKLSAKKLEDNDAFEASILEEGVEKMLENDVNKLANEAYEELQKSFKHTLKGNVLRIVGFDNRYDQKWEVDHCNGRHSAITEYMSDRVKQLFRQEFDVLLQPEIEKMLIPTKAALVKEFREVFNRAVREQIRSQAQEAAKVFLIDVLGKEVKKFQKKAISGAEEAFLGRKPIPTPDDAE